jgi:hypothetical protein
MMRSTIWRTLALALLLLLFLVLCYLAAGIIVTTPPG